MRRAAAERAPKKRARPEPKSESQCWQCSTWHDSPGMFCAKCAVARLARARELEPQLAQATASYAEAKKAADQQEAILKPLREAQAREKRTLDDLRVRYETATKDGCRRCLFSVCTNCDEVVVYDPEDDTTSHRNGRWYNCARRA